jgi:hypothetical protein
MIKLLGFIFLIIVCFPSWGADNFISLSDYTKCTAKEPHRFFQEKEDCEKESSEYCISIAHSWECQYSIIEDVFIDDISRPIRNKTDVVSCVEKQNTDADGNVVNPEIPACHTALNEKVCDDDEAEKFINAEYTEVYCSKITGYEQKNAGKKLVIDEAKKAAHEAKVSQERSMVDAIAQAEKLQACGKKVMALMLVRNQPKELTTAQVKQLVSTYADVKGLLETGSLNSAKEEILAVVADGTLITEEDKTALAAEVDKCLGL